MRRTASWLRAAGPLALLLVLVGQAWAQPSVPYPLGVQPPSLSQYTIRVNPTVAPNLTIIGCETDITGAATVNGWTIAGSATGGNPSIAARQCTGGDGNIAVSINPLGTGTVVLGGNVTTFVQFYPAIQFCNTNIAPSTAVNMIPTRLAANDWALARTAAGAETFILNCSIPLPWRTTASKGARLDSFSISQQITVAALTSNSAPTLATNTYVNNIANAIVSTYGGALTITQPTATQANPYLTAGTLATAAFMTTAATQVNLDWTVVLQNTGVYRLYGIAITWTMAAY